MSLEQYIGRTFDLRSLILITEDELKGKKSLGTARGQDLVHCFYLVARYYEGDFLSMVKYYSIEKPSEPIKEEGEEAQSTKFPVSINFYGDK
ncbi:MAG: hypothetical protein AABW49_03760 [Nanoarchaeota archaeon]